MLTLIKLSKNSSCNLLWKNKKLLKEQKFFYFQNSKKNVLLFEKNKQLNIYKRFVSKHQEITWDYDVGYEKRELSAWDKAKWVTIASIALIGLGTIYYEGKKQKEETLEKGDIAAWEQTSFPPKVQQRMSDTFSYLAGGIGITAASSVLMFRSGLAERIMLLGPWPLLGITLVGTIGSLIATQMIPKEKTVAKHIAWILFNSTMAFSLCPLGYFGGRLVQNAALTTGCIVGGLSIVAASAPSESFLWMGGPLSIGLGIILASSFGRMFFPTSSFLQNITLYGGN